MIYTQPTSNTPMMLSSDTFVACFSTHLLRKSLNPSSLEWLSPSSSYALMATSTKLSIVLVHTSPNIQSKLFSVILFRVTVQSKFIVIYLYNYSHLCRCLASLKDLDAPGQAYCHCEHTDLLLEHKTTQELWDNYGLVGNIEVCYSRYSSYYIYLMYLITGFHSKLSTQWYPPNDISRSASSSY